MTGSKPKSVRLGFGHGEEYLLRLRPVEETAGGQHAVMQYPADENALVIYPVKDDMFLALDPPVSAPDPITRAAHLRRGGKPPKALFQTIDV